MKTLIGQDLLKAVSCLCQRDVIILPTDTGYMLACNALDEQAVDNLLVLTAGRDASMELLLPNFMSCEKFATQIPPVFSKLASKHSPGPIGYMLKTKYVITDTVTCGMEKATFRVPAHPVAQDLLKKVNFPLAAVAVPGREGAVKDPVTAVSGLEGLVCYVLDGGDLLAQEMSLVAYEDGEIILYRQGAVTADMILEATGSQVTQYISPILPSAEKITSLS